MDNSTTIINVERPPVDLRHILEVNDNILTACGAVLNAFLLYLIFYKTSNQISTYKIILIQNCLVDVLFNAVNGIVKLQCDFKNGTFFMVMSGPLNNLSPEGGAFAIGVWVGAVMYCASAIPVQFIYRYYIIVKQKKPLLRHYALLLATAAFSAFTYSITVVIVFWPDYTRLAEKRKMLEADPYYFRGVPNYFATADIFHWPLRLHFSYATFILGFSYLITVITGIKVLRYLKDKEHHFTEQTKKTHKQMTITMILQAAVPLVFGFIPLGTIISSIVFQINIPGFGVYVGLFLSTQPVANPLVTIFSVASYREVVFRFVARFIPDRLLNHPRLGGTVSTYAISRNIGTSTAVTPLA